MAKTVTIGASAVSRKKRQFWSEHFGVSPIVTFIDDEGDETEDPDMARMAVVKLGEASWLTVDLDEYGAGVRH